MAPKPKEKPKPSSAPSQPPPPIEDLFASLNKHIQRSEFEQAVKVADQGQSSFFFLLALNIHFFFFFSFNNFNLQFSSLQFSQLPLGMRTRFDAKLWL